MARRRSRRRLDTGVDLYGALVGMARRNASFVEYPGYAVNALPFFQERYRLLGERVLEHPRGRVRVLAFDGATVYLVSNPRRRGLVERVVVYYRRPGDRYDEVYGLRIAKPREYIARVREKLHAYLEGNGGRRKGKRILVCAQSLDGGEYDCVVLRMTHREERRLLLPALSRLL